MLTFCLIMWALFWVLTMYYADDMKSNGWLILFWFYKWILPFILVWVLK